MLPEGAHNRENDYNYIFLNRKSEFLYQSKNSTNYFLYGLNMIKTKYDSSVRRGAIVKAMAIFSPYHFIDEFKYLLENALELHFNDSSITVLEDLYKVLNNNIENFELPSSLEQLIMRRGIAFNPIGYAISKHKPDAWNYPVNIKYNNNLYPITIQLHRSYCEFGNVSLISLIKTFGEQVMRIFHGIVTNQRIMFVGYNHAAKDIAQMVVSSVAMVSPPIINIIRRAFAYSNLSDLSFLEVPGYIAGVTNPMFQQKDSWWDILCILDLNNNTGSIFTPDEWRTDELNTAKSVQRRVRSASSGNINSTSNQSVASINYLDDNSHVRLDQKFINAVIAGINANLSENWVRQQFYDYTMNILNLARDSKSLSSSLRLDESVRKMNSRNMVRASILSENPEFSSLYLKPWEYKISECAESVTELKSELISGSNLETAEVENISSSENNNDIVDAIEAVSDLPSPTQINEVLWHHIRRLQSENNLINLVEVQSIYKDLDENLTSELDIQWLLVLLPESTGGLTLISAGLLNANPIVRNHAFNIISRLSNYESSLPVFEALNKYILSVYNTLKLAVDNGSLQEEILLFQQKIASSQIEPEGIVNDSAIESDLILGTDKSSAIDIQSTIVSLFNVAGEYVTENFDNDEEEDEEELDEVELEEVDEEDYNNIEDNKDE